jgi:hypothetical protein
MYFFLYSDVSMALPITPTFCGTDTWLISPEQDPDRINDDES